MRKGRPPSIASPRCAVFLLLAGGPFARGRGSYSPDARWPRIRCAARSGDPGRRVCGAGRGARAGGHRGGGGDGDWERHRHGEQHGDGRGQQHRNRHGEQRRDRDGQLHRDRDRRHDRHRHGRDGRAACSDVRVRRRGEAARRVAAPADDGAVPEHDRRPRRVRAWQRQHGADHRHRARDAAECAARRSPRGGAAGSARQLPPPGSVAAADSRRSDVRRRGRAGRGAHHRRAPRHGRRRVRDRHQHVERRHLPRRVHQEVRRARAAPAARRRRGDVLHDGVRHAAPPRRPPATPI